MIKAIIVDDEAHIREEIRRIVDDHFSKEVVVVSQVGSVNAALESILKFEPGLLFLDINLPDGTGFDLIEKSDYTDFSVIFITGFDHHAIKAIKVGALDYILKPVDVEEFVSSVKKAIENSRKENHLEKLIEVSQEFFKGADNKRVILKTANMVYAIYEDDIIFCQSDGNYTTFYILNEEKIVVSKPIKKIAEILSENCFIRCHQSYMVNKKHVVKYDKQGVLILHNDFKVPVSSRRKEYVLKIIF